MSQEVRRGVGGEREVWRGIGGEGEEGSIPSWQPGNVESGTFTAGRKKSVSCHKGREGLR